MKNLKSFNHALVLIGVFLCASGTNAQQTNNPLARLQQLSRRVKQKFETQNQTNQSQQFTDQQLRRSMNSSNQYPVNQANRIGTNAEYLASRQTGYYQQSQGVTEQNNSVLTQPAPPNNSVNYRQSPTDYVNDFPNEDQPIRGASNRLPAPVSNGSSTRLAIPHSNQPPYGQYQTHQNQVPFNHSFEDPGIVGIHDPGMRHRFPHFSSRIPASERVVMLEDELAKVDKKLRLALVDNELLQGKLDENEQLLVEIQASIDEAISQLTAAATMNQDLREKVVRLETEKNQQKANYESLLDKFQGKLDELLQAEIAGK